jgi:hypothetical protein
MRCFIRYLRAFLYSSLTIFIADVRGNFKYDLMKIIALLEDV